MAGDRLDPLSVALGLTVSGFATAVVDVALHGSVVTAMTWLAVGFYLVGFALLPLAVKQGCRTSAGGR